MPIVVRSFNFSIGSPRVARRRMYARYIYIYSIVEVYVLILRRMIIQYYYEGRARIRAENGRLMSGECLRSRESGVLSDLFWRPIEKCSPIIETTILAKVGGLPSLPIADLNAAADMLIVCGREIIIYACGKKKINNSRRDRKLLGRPCAHFGR